MASKFVIFLYAILFAGILNARTLNAQQDEFSECAGALDLVEKKLCEQRVRAERATQIKEEASKRYHGICERCSQCDEGGNADNVDKSCKADCATVPDRWKYREQGDFADSTFAKCQPTGGARGVNFYDCVDMECVHEYDEAKNWKKITRKEYRMLTKQERRRFHAAITKMKESGRYDEFASMHAEYGREVSGAHHGPAFLPWHREFLKQFEFSLRKIDPDVFLPYWDTTLEARLKNPADSILFSAALMGKIDPNTERITDGFMANWKVANWSEEEVNARNEAGNSFTFSMYRNIQRQLGKLGRTRPSTDEQIQSFLNQSGLDRVLAYHESYNRRCPGYSYVSTLESIHGYTHIFMGGEMSDPITAGNDPIFFLWHSFIDMLWELWRNKHQDADTRESAYPSKANIMRCSSDRHFPDVAMMPFGLTNIQGLLNNYTDSLYHYAPRPFCTAQHSECGSKWLFCDGSHGQPQCASKLREGSDCTGYFMGEDMCYEGECLLGVCRAA